MSFGEMPIANGFLAQKCFESEFVFDMDVAFCDACKLFQLVNQPSRERMFNENYAFFSGTSKFMGQHFNTFANYMIEAYLKNIPDPFVVEVGSNDGIMLQNFAKQGIRHLGIEPSKNVADIATSRGIKTIIEFFDTSLVERIVAEHGRADAYLAANVMCHISDIGSVVNAIKALIKPKGIVVFEDPYLGDVIEKTTYDQIYDEHVFLYSVHAVQYLFQQYGMEVVDVQPQVTHGGSMRYFVGNKDAWNIHARVGQQLNVEREIGLTDPNTFQVFRKNCHSHREKLLNVLVDIKAAGKTIAGYAATSKSTTILNYCGIGHDILDCIYDTTPIKHGKFSPGMHIPIIDHREFSQSYPDYALLFAYNHEREIMEKENQFMEQGGRWITYVPEIKVL